MKKLVAFVEGEGDADAVPRMISKVFNDLPAGMGVWEKIVPATPWRVGNVGKLVKDDFKEWTAKLKAVTLKPDVRSVLLLLDGDTEEIFGKKFCPVEVARSLAEKARQVGAGVVFSVAVAFAVCEYESWIVAGCNSLAGRSFPDGRRGLREGVTRPESDLEKMRDAKGWLSRNMGRPYKETLDQAEFTNLLDLGEVRSQRVRSFVRFENAIRELVGAVVSGQHVATPL